MVSEAFKNTFSGFQNLLKRFKHHKERWKGGMRELSSPDKGTSNFILEDTPLLFDKIIWRVGLPYIFYLSHHLGEITPKRVK